MLCKCILWFVCVILVLFLLFFVFVGVMIILNSGYFFGGEVFFLVMVGFILGFVMFLGGVFVGLIIVDVVMFICC